MHHIIIGAGPGGVVAAETLRKMNPIDQITLIGDEAAPPYSRMAIPYLLVEDIEESGTFLRATDHYKKHGIDYVQGRVASIDSNSKNCILENGVTLNYDKLCIASGSTPISPPIEGIDLPNVHSCWTLEDSRQIAALAKPNAKVVLMGAGFIGCIILESLVKRKVNLSVIEMGSRMVPRMLDEKAGGLLKQWCIEEGEGVGVYTSTKVDAIKLAGNSSNTMEVILDNGVSIEADLVISATGVKSNVAFLKDSGLDIDHGVIVNNRMQTNLPDIYAIGDVAQGMDFSTGEYTVQAIQPTATDHGRIAGLNMAGKVAEHNGSLNMNILDTLGLISTSYGLWMGAEGGDNAEIYTPELYKYMNLKFGVGDESDVLVGASTVGMTQHVGVLRGLIESKIHLGKWKQRLINDPMRIMDAYVASTQELDNAV
ncbi:MAG: FAD/NAD(P)-binding oxidoreductase [Cocleimonas sp.]